MEVEFSTSLCMGSCKHLHSEIIPLICTSAIWDQCPVFQNVEFPQGSPWTVTAVLWLLDGRYSFLS